MAIREQVLEMLRGGEEVSGERMASRLGVSRNAVWKAMAGLRGEGYGIEAVTNRGYRLVSVPERLQEAEIRRWLQTERIGREMEIHDRIDSTNNRAKALAAAGAPHGFLVASDSQSGGRGRLGRSFYSPEHSGIYMTCVFRPDCPAEQAPLLTSLAAVAAAEAVEGLTGAEVKIKWVNDLYIGGRKICGILSEAGLGMEAGKLDWAVVGIGINTGRMVFPPELKDIATSIGNETGTAPDRNRLAAEICNRLEARFAQLETGEFLAESRRRSNVIGREVLVMESGRQYPARALDIDDRGQLVIETSGGVSRLGFGEVSLRWREP